MIITPFGHVDPAAKVPAPQGGGDFLQVLRPGKGDSPRGARRRKKEEERPPAHGGERGPSPSSGRAREEGSRTDQAPPAAKGGARRGGGEKREDTVSRRESLTSKEGGEGARRIPSAGKGAPSPSSDLSQEEAPAGLPRRSRAKGERASLLSAPAASPAPAYPEGSAGAAKASSPQAVQGAARLKGGRPAPERGAFAKTPLRGYRSRVHPTPEISPAAGESILRRISLFLDEAGGEAVLDLDPPSLGRLAVRMVLEGDKVELRLHASTEAVARFLEKNLAPLRQALADQGLAVAAFDVTSGGPEENPGDFARKAESRARAARTSGAVGGAEEAVPPPGPSLRPWDGGSALDVLA